MVVFYCLAIAAVSLIGGILPLARKLTHSQLQIYLSISGGAMLGAAFFHVMPESAELLGKKFGLFVGLGVVGLFLIERFLSPHSHDTSHDSLHENGSVPCHELHPHETKTAAPPIGGWAAIIGLFIHTIMGGIGLGSAVLGVEASKGLGLAVFLAIVLHKPADSLTISTLLIKNRISSKIAIIIQIIFALMIPLGVVLFVGGESFIESQLETAFTGCVLAFSAGTFICIAMSDLLPEVQFHSHDRIKLFVAMILGLLIMLCASAIESWFHKESHQDSMSYLIKNVQDNKTLNSKVEIL